MGIVDLTKEGTLDWTHYGIASSSDVNRKVKGNIIGNLKATVPFIHYSNNPVSFRWSDGNPISIEDGTTTGVYISKSGNSFTLTVPANTQRQILRLYVGMWRSSLKVTATLSDGSPAYTDSSLTGSSNAVIELNFQTKTSNQSLTVTVVGGSDEGNITFQASTLSLAP